MNWNKLNPLFFRASFPLTLIINLFLVVIIFATLDDAQIYIYFNSDTLYIPSLYQDLFLNQNPLRGWHINGAPNFFPDLLLFSVIHSFFNSFITAAFTYSLVQLVILLSLLGLLYKTIFRELSPIHLSIGCLFMTSFLMVMLVSNNFVDTFYILSIGYHLGAFIMSLTALILFFSYLWNPRKNLLVFLFLIIILGIVNDRLFMVIYVFPTLTLSVLLLKKNKYRKSLIRLLIFNLISAIIGMLLFTLIKSSGIVKIISLEWKVFNFKNILPAMNVLFGQHWHYLKAMDFRGIADLLFLISTGFHIFYLIRSLTTYYKGNETNLKELIYLLLFTAIVLITLFMPVINGSYVAWSLMRYNIYSLYLGVFGLGFVIYKLEYNINLKKWLSKTILIVLLSATSIYSVFRFNKEDIGKGLSEFFNYYPEKVECLDQLAKEGKIKNGVATYWQAKYIMMFSRENLKVFTIFHSLAPWYHVMNEKWYYFEDGSEPVPRDFDFLITDKIEYPEIEKYLGSPIDTLQCTDLEIFRYSPFRFSRETRRPYLLTTNE